MTHINRLLGLAGLACVFTTGAISQTYGGGTGGGTTVGTTTAGGTTAGTSGGETMSGGTTGGTMGGTSPTTGTTGGPATVYNFHSNYHLGFDRPESWGLKYFVSLSMLSGLPVPPSEEGYRVGSI